MVLSKHFFGKGLMDEAVFRPEIREQMDRAAATVIGEETYKVVFWSAVLSIVNVEVCGKSCVMSGDQFLILNALANGCATVQEITEATNINKDVVKDKLTLLQKKRAEAVVEAAGDVYGLRAAQEVKFTAEE
jgi:hypothetical protein